MVKIRKDYRILLGNDFNRYIENLKIQNRYTKKRIYILNDINKFQDFITDSFQWSKTKEGHEYWLEISKRQLKKCLII